MTLIDAAAVPTPDRRSPRSRSGPRLFATADDEPRARRASDALLLASAGAALIVGAAFAEPSPGFARALGRFLAAFPRFLDGAWQLILDAVALLAIGLLVTAAVRRRWLVVRDVLLAIALTSLIWPAVGRVVDGTWPNMWDALRSAGPPPWYPAPRVALPAAMVLTLSPHLTLPMRRLARRGVGLSLVAAVALGATRPLGAVAGLLVAVVAASAIHLVFGSSDGRPTLDLVRLALADLGVRTRTLGAADRQQAGLFALHATNDGGEQLVVKMYGRDAHDTAFVSTIWRTIWFREAGAPLRFRRLEQVEHEAFLTLFAKQAGIRTDDVVMAGPTPAGDALLVVRRHGVAIADDPHVDAALVVDGLWRAVRRLHGAGVAHGQIDHRCVVVADGEVGLVDFRGATIAPSATQRHTDVVQALITTILVAGPDVALAAARDALGTAALADALPFLQAPALTPAQRQQVRSEGLDLDQVREQASALAGIDAPPVQELRRVRTATVVRVVLPAVAIVALVSGLAGLDFGALLDELADAIWWLVLLAAVLTQLPRLAQAVSTLGASPVPLPLRPVYALQLALAYIGIALPSAAARVAVNIRFFQRHGVAPGSALAAGALDSVGQFVVQATLLVTLLVSTPASIDLDFGHATAAAGRLAVAVIVAIAVAIAVVAAVARWRQFVARWARRLGTEALAAVRGLGSLRRLGMLLGGNLASEVVFAVALGAFVRALGHPIGLPELLVVTISVSLLSGLVPVPGGIGVAEGALTVGLVRAGMPEESAFAAALMYRMASFYLPPVWGYFALRWLEQNKHL